MAKTTVVFGGTGFIGAFFAQHILSAGLSDLVYLVDKESPEDKSIAYRRTQLRADPRVIYLHADVRHPLNDLKVDGDVMLVANFAAVHREPGHEDVEYYETNLLGAENVCKWTESRDCQAMVFTSSISPYGVSEAVRDEMSLPVPSTAYGGSKLVAEKIHRIWQAADDDQRRLVIVRPGVVFGPGEGGNVSRLIRAVIHRYFFYMGNQNTRKAGVYVKELCNAMVWVLASQSSRSERVSLFNMSMNPGPSIKEYVDAVCRVARINRWVLGVPYWLLLAASTAIDLFAKPLGIRHPFSPVRIRKLVRSNNILPTYLVSNNYPFMYNLDAALEDWRQSCPEEWS